MRGIVFGGFLCLFVTIACKPPVIDRPKKFSDLIGGIECYNRAVFAADIRPTRKQVFQIMDSESDKEVERDLLGGTESESKVKP